MPISLQVVYPVSETSTFDHDYYLTKHMPLVEQHIGSHIASQVVTRGVADGGGGPTPFHAIATFTFSNQEALDAAFAAAGPVLEDIPKFTTTQPQMMVGDVIS